MKEKNVVDKKRIENAVKEILLAIGENPQREGLIETPSRIANMYAELFSGINVEAMDLMQVTFSEEHHEMVIIKDIPFYSMCEHHLLPFYGKAHVGYIPKGSVVGISKLARVVETLARRPQLQERLTGQIADSINKALMPIGVAVVIEAEHLCMTMRGIKKPGSLVVTSANRGAFRKYPATRAEFFSLIKGNGA